MKQNKYIIISIFIISFLIWNRFISSLDPLRIKEDILSKNILIFLAFWMCLISLFVFIDVLRELLRISLTKKNVFIYNIAEYFVILQIEFFQQILRNLSEFLYKRFPINSYTDKVALYLVVYCIPYMVHIYFITLIPKVIVALIFLSELVYKQELNIFYESLLLLAIPLIINSHLFVIKDLSNKYRIFLEQFLDVQIIEDEYAKFSVKETLPEGTYLTESDLNTLMALWANYYYSNYFIDTYIQVRNFYILYEYLAIYLIYTLGWSYYLYLVLEKILEF